MFDVLVHGCGTVAFDKQEPCTSFSLRENRKTILLIDIGINSLTNILRSNDISDITNIFLSHYAHVDHSGDLPALFFHAYYCLKEGTLHQSHVFNVYGPAGTKEFVSNIFALYPSMLSLKPKIKIHEIDKASTFFIRNICLNVFPVDHGGVLCNGVTASCKANKFFGFSGDTRSCPNLKEHLSDTKTAIIDTSYSAESGRNSSSHMNSMEVGELAASTNIKTVCISHIYPSSSSSTAVKEIRKNFNGEIKILKQNQELIV